MSSSNRAVHDVTVSTAAELARQIAKGELSACDVIDSHIRHIQRVDPRLNAVAVPMWEQARQEARRADDERARGQPLGPLHGVPVTIKEMFDVEGTATTAGLNCRAAHRARSDAAAVTQLRRAGAIVVGKTNSPQMGMMAETDNPVYGRTNNPWDLERSPGGSSGGEGAIIASGGSPLGLGSDAGGSIRIPCHVCGIHGLKPTSRRLSTDGHWTLPHWPPEWMQPGPMARSVDDLWLAMQALTSSTDCPTGPDVVPAALKDPSRVPLDQLRIGIYTDLGDIPAAPTLRRAVDEAAEALRQRGACVEPFAPPDIDEAWRTYIQIFYADGLYHVKRAFKGSPRDWRVRQIVNFTRPPSWLRPPLAFLFDCLGQHHFAHSFRLLGRRILPVSEYQEILQRQHTYRRRFAQALDAQALDAIICPPSTSPAIQHGEFYINYGLIYTALYNLLGTPAGVVATTRVKEGEECERPASRDRVSRAFARIESGSTGLPVGVQVVARWWREDVALAVMQAIEERARRRDDYPLHPPQ